MNYNFDTGSIDRFKNHICTFHWFAVLNLKCFLTITDFKEEMVSAGRIKEFYSSSALIQFLIALFPPFFRALCELPEMRRVGRPACLVWRFYMLKWLYLRDDFRRLTNHDKTWLLFFVKMHSHEMMTDIRTSVQLSYKHAKLLDFSSPPIEMQQIE